MNVFETIGRLVVAHYRKKAWETDYPRMVERLRKQGWPERLVILVLTGKEPRP